MKIQSYNVEMQSQHSFSMEFEQDLSFSTMLFQPQQQKKVDLEPVEAVSNKEASSMFSGEMRSIESIIQSLISMLESRIQSIPTTSLHKRYEEHEKLNLSTTGSIKSDKGQVDFDLNFSMSRDFVVENRIDIVTPFDPLVINLDGELPKLSKDTFSFDLDNDGEEDQISKLGAGSGFLALDKNEDGIINQGSELFGTLIGNGFDELSSYDDDGNNWIDENDNIFNKLRIWLNNEDENEKELVGLGETGIGAIFLGYEQSKFTYKTSFNETLGEMKSSGVFLYEDMSVGNISQIDFNAKNTKEHLAELLQA